MAIFHCVSPQAAGPDLGDGDQMVLHSCQPLTSSDGDDGGNYIS